MKSNVQSKMSTLVLSMSLMASIPVFSAEEGPRFPAPSSALSLALLPEDPRSKLFSSEEWTDMRIGYALIEERIRGKEEILKFLKDQAIPLPDKMLCCQEEFGTVPTVGGSTSQGIQKGIEQYSSYIAEIRDTYILAQDYAQNIIHACTQDEKNNFQNTLYYFLSFEARHFRKFVEFHYSHQIPERSLEDTFYEMIFSKMCGSATKEHNVLNDYMVITFTERGVKKQIDDERLLNDYQKKHNDLIKEFNENNPIFWLGSVSIQNVKSQKEIKKIFDGQVNMIRDQLNKCREKVINTMKIFSGRLGSYNQQHLFDKNNDVISVYQVCGPWILEAIKGYEAVTEEIKKIEKDSIQWLVDFKERKKSLFRNLPMSARTSIDKYLNLQEKKEADRIALEKKQAAERLEAIKREKMAARQARQQEKREEKQKMASATSQKESPDLLNSNALASPTREATQKKTKAPKVIQEGTEKDVPGMNVSSSSVIELPSAESKQAITSPIEVDSQPLKPKVKVKTRPERPVASSAEGKMEEEEMKPQELSLPAECQTAEFTSFMDSLLAERNDRKLKKSFQELNSYGIFAENAERNNKGYFSIQSPRTGQIHVATYHHLHADNPYASIFMALRQVLKAAGIGK